MSMIDLHTLRLHVFIVNIFPCTSAHNVLFKDINIESLKYLVSLQNVYMIIDKIENSLFIKENKYHI